MLTLIVAVAENNVIGCKNRLIWHISEDLKRFKTLTLGHPVIMGRKTYESIGKPLPGRLNIIVSGQQGYSAEGCTVVHSLQEAIDAAKFNDQLFVIGGESIYRQALPLCDSIQLTRVHKAYEGDTFFPDLSPNEWQEVEREDFTEGKDFKHPFSFIHYKKIEQ